MKNILIIAAAVFFMSSCVKEGDNFLNTSLEITEEELLSTIEELPDEIADLIKENPVGFAEALLPVIETILTKDSFLFFPVNRIKPLPDSYAPDDLVDLDTYGFTVNKPGMKIRETVVENLSNMLSAAEKNGLEIMISSAYRSYTYQKNLYNYYVGIWGQERTDRFSARPGTSQHQLGSALDFGTLTRDFAETEQGRWLLENGWKYGFSSSYPEGFEDLTGYDYEPWHFRYIGIEGAYLEKTYFKSLQHYLLEYLKDNIAFFSRRYKPVEE